MRVLVNKLEIVDCQYNEVPSLDGKGVYKVSEKGLRLASQIMDSVFNDFRVYPIGNWFQIPPKSKALKVEQGLNGIWVI